MIKKIFGLILFLGFLFPLSVRAADASSSFSSQPASGSGKVGENITINYTVSNLASDIYQIELWITDSDGSPFRKDWKQLAADHPAQASYEYVWRTAEAGSTAGNHRVFVKTIATSEVATEAAGAVTYNLLVASGDGDTDTDGSTSSISFDLGNLGKVIFPSTKVGSAKELIVVIIQWLIGIMGALAVIAIIYSGVMYITSGADTARAETAKKNLMWAIIGIVLVLLSYFLVELVAKVIGG